MRDGGPESMERHPSRLSLPGLGRRRWLISVPLAVVLVLGTWVLAFGLGRNPDRFPNPLTGRAAPSFTLPSLTGGPPIRLERFRGQVVVLNFWASWCNECYLEAGALEEAWRRYRDRGVVVIGVAYQDTDASARAFVRDLGEGWPHGHDPGFRTSIAYGVRGVPETFLIARDGRIAAHRNGPVTYTYLSRQISRVLGEPG
ncbi:MAG: TlpA family protein disulfide reductase [Actinomycetota bacterium]